MSNLKTRISKLELSGKAPVRENDRAEAFRGAIAAHIPEQCESMEAWEREVKAWLKGESDQ